MSYSEALKNLIEKAEREHNKAEADKLRHLLKLAQERGAGVPLLVSFVFFLVYVWARDSVLVPVRVWC